MQMMRTAPQPNRWRLGPQVAGGLTLARSEAFAACRSVGRLRDRIATTTPDLVRYGIEAMASQNQAGEVVVGASHEYDDDPFDKDALDSMVFEALRGMVRLPEERIAARWHGVYASYPGGPMFTATPHPGVTIQVAPGGAGLTMAFGLADAWWEAEG
jgi:hypothetical protein